MNDVRLQDAGFELSYKGNTSYLFFFYNFIFREKKSGMQQIHIDDK